MESKLEEMIQKYSDMILRISYQNCFNKTDSEDILQEVFLRLYNNIDVLNQNEENVKAWLIRVTINLSKDFNKSAWYRKVGELDENNMSYSFDEDEIEILKELSKLKPVYRNIIYLYYYEGYKINEISEILNMNINTVSSNLTRARKQLKDVLEEVGGDIYA